MWQALMRQECGQHGEEYKGHELVVMLGTQAVHQSTVAILREKYGSEGISFMSNSILNELRGGELDKVWFFPSSVSSLVFSASRAMSLVFINPLLAF